MSRRWVVNASPLIFLGKISGLGLLQDLCEEIVVPIAVAHEIERGPRNDPACLWLAAEGKSWIREAVPVDPVIAGWDLGEGESHVLAWAHANPAFEAVVDDLAARRCAEILTIPVRGTLGILLLAKREGCLGQVKPVFEHLRLAGFRISSEVHQAALRLANED